jgi:uridine phosphorylase
MDLFPAMDPEAPRAPNPAVLGADGCGMHIKARPGEIGPYVIVAGDPGRVPVIARFLEGAREVTTYRGFVVWTGSLEGSRVSVVAHGIGGPSSAIVFEELVGLGAHTLVRVGTSGSLQRDVRVGDIVVSTAAIRDEGTTAHYMPEAVPVLASQGVILALCESARDLGHRAHCGMTHCKDAFYAELPGFTASETTRKLKWEAFEACGALCTEMEGAALFAVATLRRVRAGGCFAVIGDTAGDGAFLDAGERALRARDAAIATVVDAIRRLVRSDRARFGKAAAAPAAEEP